MNRSGPFSESDDDDKTIIRPSPGGRRRQPPISPPTQHVDAGWDGGDLGAGDVGGTNPLVAGSFSLLSLVSKLRSLPVHEAINDLQQRLVDKVIEFRNGALQDGASQNHVNIAQYFLCSLIDETVLNTPWGNQSSWGNNSLSSQFFKKMWGGEEFFQILNRLKQLPTQNLNILELAYLCLSLGFQGKYRFTDNGFRILEEERTELYAIVQRVKGDAERVLSGHWQGLRGLRSALARHTPLWVFGVVAGLLITFIYMGFAYSINRASDRVYKQWDEIADAVEPQDAITIPLRLAEQQPLPVEIQPPQPLQPPLIERLRRLLAGEIDRNLVDVVDGNVLRITNAFPSGSAQVDENFHPMLAKIARELAKDNSRIAVIGHTDNRKIKFSMRFPSNWHLSRARAESVKKILDASAALGDRVSFDGRGDTDPVAPNYTAADRALNRRVDIRIR